MQNNSFKRYLRQLFSFILGVSILSGSLVADAQRRRGAAPRKSTATGKTTGAAKSAAVGPEEKIDLTGLTPPDRGETMGAAFKNGMLPVPAAAPEGTVEEQAAALAEMVSAGDDNSTAALVTALKAAGYGIRNENGDVDFNQSKWQGIALDGWHVAAMAKLYGEGWGVGLGKLGEGLSLVVPEWKKETNANDLTESIRRAALGDNQPLRFWAHFVIELGRRADTPFDLRNDDEVKHARLDAIQFSLIMTRLAADAHVAARRARATRAKLERDETNRNGVVRFVRASNRGGANFARATFANGATVNPDDSKPLPCQLNEMEALILDLNATATSIGFGPFVDYLEDKKVVGKGAGAKLDAANTILTITKLIATYAALDSEITMEGGMLTRTKTTQPGERKALTAKVKIDVGKWQTMNCIRPALNAAGIDFSLPGDGALAGTRVEWVLAEGGVANTKMGRVWHTLKNYNRIRNGETVENDDAIVTLDFANATAEGKKHYNYTDANGESKIYAVGAPQKKDLSGQVLRPVMKTMAVEINIQVKTMRLKDATAAAGTANDIAGNVLAFFTKDIPGFVYGTAAETLYRSPAGSSKLHHFPVKDWVPCDGNWRGTVTYHRTFDETLVSGGKGVMTTGGHEISRTHREDLAHIKVEQVPGTKSFAGELKTFARMASVYESAQFSRWFFNDTCGNRGDTSRDKITERVMVNTTQGAGGGAADNFHFSVFGDRAHIGFSLPDIAGKYTSKTAMRTTGFCNQAPPTSGNSEKDVKIEGARYSQDVPVDPKNPNVLRGQMTIPGSKGWRLVFSWDLSRCQ